MLEDAVPTQDTVTQLVAAIRRVARTLPGGAELVAAHATVSGHDYTAAGKPRITWDDEAARAALVDALVRDATAVLAAVALLDRPPQGPAADAVGLLALVAGQNVFSSLLVGRRSGRAGPARESVHQGAGGGVE